MSEKHPVLFWSTRCRFCAEVQEAMRLLGKEQLFENVCIEAVPRSSLPSKLTDVPSIWDPNTQRFHSGKGQVLEFVAKAGMNSRRDTPIASPPGMAGSGGSFNVDSLQEPDGPEIGGFLNEPNAPLIPLSAPSIMTDKNPDELNAKLAQMKADGENYGMRL